MSETDFGRYLATVEERDIDLLLMEEFQCDDAFVSWFCSLLGLTDLQPGGAWHSVSDANGETDLLLRVTGRGKRIGVLIENKVAAPEQDRQAERYHLRGVRSREAGRFDEYVTAMCAPQRYLDGLPANSAYQYRVPYEAIAEWFAAQEGRRAAWRSRIMQEAIEQGRRGYTMQVSAVHTDFHQAYWEHIRRNHPRIRMAKPKNKGAKSTWIIMAGHDFPKGVKLHHKLDQRVMELGFERRRVEEIQDAAPDLPEGVIPVQKGGTAALMADVPSIDINLDFATQMIPVERALATAYLLMPFARLLSRDGVHQTVLRAE